MASVEDSNAGARMAFCVARGLKRSVVVPVANRCLTGDDADNRQLDAQMAGGPKSSLARHSSRRSIRPRACAPSPSRLPSALAPTVSTRARARRVYVFHLCSITTFLVIVRGSSARANSRSHGGVARIAHEETKPLALRRPAARPPTNLHPRRRPPIESECPPSARMDPAPRRSSPTPPPPPRPDPEDPRREPAREGPRPDPDPDPDPSSSLSPRSTISSSPAVSSSPSSSSSPRSPRTIPAPSVRVPSSRLGPESRDALRAEALLRNLRDAHGDEDRHEQPEGVEGELDVGRAAAARRASSRVPPPTRTRTTRGGSRRRTRTMYGQKSTAVSPRSPNGATYGENGESRARRTICAPSRITAWSSAANRLPSLMKSFSTMGRAACRAA